MPPFVTIIVPCRNEERFVAACLESILATDYPKTRFEILVVDGMSEDATREILRRYVCTDPLVRMLDNPKMSAPAGLNIGLQHARGEVLLRMDAHSLYPPHYVSRLVAHLVESGADNVGGICRAQPANLSAKAAAIAVALSHPLGVGNSYCRIGVSRPRWVDTVPFGCYRRDVFDRIGRFDEDLVRNQDDELNARLRRHGGRILLVPDVRFEYYARDSLVKLWRMFYQYGFFKPLAVLRAGGAVKARQLAPAAFVLALVGSILLGFFAPAARWLAGAVLAGYGALVVGCAAAAAARHGVRSAVWLAATFPTLHISYGIGSLHGLVDLAWGARRGAATSAGPVSISR